jgi:hypothetical protein
MSALAMSILESLKPTGLRERSFESVTGLPSLSNCCVFLGWAESATSYNVTLSKQSCILLSHLIQNMIYLFLGYSYISTHSSFTSNRAPRNYNFISHIGQRGWWTISQPQSAPVFLHAYIYSMSIRWKALNKGSPPDKGLHF